MVFSVTCFSIVVTLFHESWLSVAGQWLSINDMISILYLFLVFWCFKFDVETLVGVFRFRMKVPFNHNFCYYRFMIGLRCCWDRCFRVKDVCVGVISCQDVIYLILMWVFFSVHHIHHIYLFRQPKVYSFKFKYIFFDFTFSGVSSCIGRFERMRLFLSCAWTEVLGTNLFDKHLVHLEES